MLSINQTCFLVYAQYTIKKGGGQRGVNFKQTHFQMRGAATGPNHALM